MEEPSNDQLRFQQLGAQVQCEIVSASLSLRSSTMAVANRNMTPRRT